MAENSSSNLVGKRNENVTVQADKLQNINVVSLVHDFDFSVQQYFLEIQPPYGTLILNQQKSIETRRYPLPEALVDKEITLIEQNSPGIDGVSSLKDIITAHQSDVNAVGIATFSESFRYTTAEQW